MSNEGEQISGPQEAFYHEFGLGDTIDVETPEGVKRVEQYAVPLPLDAVNDINLGIKFTGNLAKVALAAGYKSAFPSVTINSQVDIGNDHRGVPVVGYIHFFLEKS